MSTNNNNNNKTNMSTPVVATAVPEQQPKFAGVPVGSATEPTPETSCKAIASLVLSIIGLFLLGIVLGPIAICLAVSAKNDIKERPQQVQGTGMANAGLIIGIIGTVLSIVLIIIIFSGGASDSSY